MEKNISLIILSLIFIVACSPQTNPVIKKNITNVADVVVEQANITNTTIIEIPSYTISPIPSLHPGNLTIYFIDVGQGDRIFIIAPNRETMLIDGGRQNKGPEIVSLIRNLGYNKIDYVVASHPDADHIGGLIYAIPKLKPRIIVDNNLKKDTQTYKEYLSTWENSTEISHQAVYYDSSLDFAEGVITSLIVPYDDGEGYKSDDNENSILVKLTYKNTSFLFTGDCEEDCEIRIGDSNLDSDVLKVGHHGSCKSSTMFFLNKVSPMYSVIQVGENSYGHPCIDSLSRLEYVKSRIYRTDQSGTIIFTTDGENISILTSK